MDNDHNTSNTSLREELYEDIENNVDEQDVTTGKNAERLWHFLKAIPFCELSEKAYYNYAKRFGLDEAIFRAFVKLENQNREGGKNE